MWRLALAAHDFLKGKPTDPARECSFAQAYWKSQQAGTTEAVPADSAAQLRGYFNEAVRDTEDAAKKQPRSVYAHLIYANYLQYYTLMDKSNIPKMLYEYQRAVALAPGMGYAHYELALGYFGCGDSSDVTINKIVAEAKKAVSLDPRLTNSYFWIASVYDWPGHRNAKISKMFLDKYLQAQPDQANRPDIVAFRKRLTETVSSRA